MAHSEAVSGPSASIAEVEAAAVEAESYDTWFRAEVERGLREANDPNAFWHTQEEIEREAERECAQWQAQIDGMEHRD